MMPRMRDKNHDTFRSVSSSVTKRALRDVLKRCPEKFDVDRYVKKKKAWVDDQLKKAFDDISTS
eukprot:CAMPEP_0197536676 /NCGR_PEP_ID=MMETSP1318-20131121/54528_1 /TAXON_ID=552666 /ORGANISM="Partenskyella glossopodia, Strain RCC365" /LENGTH=63 /DNA_ID=CAMNT_0043094627 /DNA_START=216 /DNA_END=407 /DNA_ORIENTATION=+